MVLAFGNFRDDQIADVNAGKKNVVNINKAITVKNTRRVAVKPKAPRKPTPPKKTTPARSVSSSTARAGAATTSASSASGGGGGGIKESSDKAQLAALKELLDKGFAAAREAKLANAKRVYAKQDAAMVTDYNLRVRGLLDSAADNRKAESDASFDNLRNRARETTDLISQAALQGAGETDTLRSQLMAVRNWDANQGEINRAFWDSHRSNQSALTDLNIDTGNARRNLAVETLNDYEQIWTNYHNQRADAYTQMGNIHANPYSDSHDPKSTAYASMAKEASSTWTNPGVQDSLQNWRGSTTSIEARLNNNQTRAGVTQKAQKRPEGSTLRKW